MHTFLGFALAAVLIAVTAVLGLGIYSLFRGGEFGRTWSNKLMRLRVVLQFSAIVIIVVAALIAGRFH
jgi:drug/metabolite transporter (DMT)-like permease